MKNFLYKCKGLEEVIFSCVIGNNADISYMFYQCKSLKKVIFSDFIINNITYMS